MRIAPGKVVDGRVEVDADLPEGATVTVLAREGDETFEADPETEAMLLEAIAQCRYGQVTPLKELLDEMRPRVNRPLAISLSELAKAQIRSAEE